MIILLDLYSSLIDFSSFQFAEGKMINIQFDEHGFLVGASINQYLLEQTRVVRHSNGERNFHAFYYLCAGADKTERGIPFLKMQIF